MIKIMVYETPTYGVQDTPIVSTNTRIHQKLQKYTKYQLDDNQLMDVQNQTHMASSQTVYRDHYPMV